MHKHDKLKKFAAVLAVALVASLCTAVAVRVTGIHAAAGAYDYAVQGNRLPTLWTADYTTTGSFIHTPVTKTTAFTLDPSVQKYDLDSTAGAFLVSLPSSETAEPDDGKCWEFSLQVANGAVSFSPSAVGDLLDASQAAYAGVDAVGDSATICYDSGTTNYYFQSRYIH